MQAVKTIGLDIAKLWEQAMRRRDFIGLLATVALPPQTVLGQAAQKRGSFSACVSLRYSREGCRYHRLSAASLRSASAFSRR